ncbi:hypothetical protein ScPMuIL_010342 [Solemya velum]
MAGIGCVEPLALAVILSIVGTAEASECCIFSTGDVYCSNYCCESWANTLYCCNNIFDRADSRDRKDSCNDWILTNWWTIVVGVTVGLVGLGFVIFFVYYYWCRPNNTRGVVYPNPHTNVATVTYTQGQVGYMGAPPPGYASTVQQPGMPPAYQHMDQGPATVTEAGVAGVPPVTYPAPPTEGK